MRLISVVLLAASAPCFVLSEPRREQSAVAVLGTFHMANPGRDVVNANVDDVLSEDRQQQLQELCDLLAAFEPTHIAVEAVPDRADELARRYAEYRAGTLEPDRNEIVQVAFRLADALGHERVWPVDHRQDMAIGSVMQYAQQNDPAAAALLGEWRGKMQATLDEVMAKPIVDIFRWANHPDRAAEHDAVYLRMAQIGGGDTMVGAQAVGTWYARNLAIFANVAALASDPDARVLVLIGAGHAPLLCDFVRGADNLDLIDITEVLK